MSARLNALRALEANDPAGYYTRQPTPSDYARFRRWAIGLYGRDLWREYAAGGWEPGGSVYE